MMNVVSETIVCVPHWGDFTDEELVREYRLFNDQRCFEELTRRYRSSLAHFLRRRYSLSEDQIEEALQAVFAQVWRKLDKFDISRRFHPWIYRIALTQTIDLLRKTRRNGSAASLDFPYGLDDEKGTMVDEIEGREDDPSREIERFDTIVAVRQALVKLQPKFRQVLELVFFQGWTRQNVADALNLTISTVSRRVSRALEQLSFYLFSEHPELYRDQGTSIICPCGA